MSFLNPLGLLGLLALPLIAGIHLYRRRFPPMEIAGLHLWAAESQVRLAGRRRERLPITATLLLELLAALLMTLAISQPRFGELARVTHLVVVLDNSASMSGRAPGEPLFRDRAVAALNERMDELDTGSVVTIILTGTRPVMLAGPAVPWKEAQTALANWDPQAIGHRFEPAWDLARQVAEESGQLLFLTDHLPPKGSHPGAMEVLSFGRKLKNVAIATAVWKYETTTGVGRIFLRIANRGLRDAQVAVTGRSSDRNVFQSTVSIPAGGTRSFQTAVRGGLRRCRIEVTSVGDGLELDNSADLIEPTARTVTVHSAFTGETDKLLRRAIEAVPDVQFGPRERAQLVFGPAATLPESDSTLWWFGLGPIDVSEAARKQAVSLTGPYLLEKRNPLIDGVLLNGVVWGGVQKSSLNVTPVISAGSRPLLARLNDTRTTAFLVNIDLARSNLGESPDWPILISNLIELCRRDLPGLNRWNYRMGETVRFRLFAGDEDPADNEGASPSKLTLAHGDGSRSLTRNNIIELASPPKPGLYEVLENENRFGEFAVNFHDVGESDLSGLLPGKRTAVTQQSAGFLIDPDASWLIMAAVAAVVGALLCNWSVLRRGG